MSKGLDVVLKAVSPSARRQELADINGKYPRLVKRVLSEASEILSAQPGVPIDPAMHHALPVHRTAAR